MAQLNWKYVSNYGRSYHIGLFHGDRTGHLLVHCNSKIVLIDFSVQKTSSYSFFIEEDLCEITIEKTSDEYRYGFDVNTDADTPTNRDRKATEKKYWRQTLLFFGGMGLLILITVIGLFAFNQAQNEKKAAQVLETYREETVAKLFYSKDEETGATKLSYSFVANGDAYAGKIALDNPQLSSGMPIEQGDEFVVAYASINPAINEIMLEQPTLKQVSMYWERAQQKHWDLHPEFSLNQVKCIIKQAYDSLGLEGLATFYLQDIPVEENERFNETTYLRLIRDINFRNLVDQECLVRIN